MRNGKKFSIWRREPYRIFFPLGIILSWGGVLHWLLHAFRILPDYRPIFHSITQVQGFLACFALGFLFTAIPRITETAPPGLAAIGVCGAAAVGTTVSAWFQLWAFSQMFWIVLVAVFLSFFFRRRPFRRTGRRFPRILLWVPISFLLGLAGSFLTGAYAFQGPNAYRLHELGKLLVLQGTFVGLVLGVGGFAFPLITRGKKISDEEGSVPDRLFNPFHLSAAALLVASFFLEVYVSLRAGLVVRALVILTVLSTSAGSWKTPQVPGLHRWLVWLSAWMILAGYLLAALFPEQKIACLHVVFIGGFALLALSIGLHVSLAHGGARQPVKGRPWQVSVIGVLILLSLVFRLLVDFDRSHYFIWLGAASAAFLTSSEGCIPIPHPYRSSGKNGTELPIP